jgi:uncharacterized protein
MTDDAQDQTFTFNPDRLRGEAALRKAARDGNPEAQFRLGVMYGNGDGVKLDYGRPVTGSSKAAAQGHESALITLAWMYANGTGVDVDEQKARELYLEAARRGSAKAQYVVATMYRFAQYGVDKDMREAVAWYLKAADQGMATAQFALGKMLMEGKGVARTTRGAAVAEPGARQRQQAR